MLAKAITCGRSVERLAKLSRANTPLVLALDQAGTGPGRNASYEMPVSRDARGSWEVEEDW